MRRASRELFVRIKKFPHRPVQLRSSVGSDRSFASATWGREERPGGIGHLRR